MAYRISSKTSIAATKVNNPNPNSGSNRAPLLENLAQFATKKNSKSKIPVPSESQLFRELGIKFPKEQLENSREIRKAQLYEAYHPNHKPSDQFVKQSKVGMQTGNSIRDRAVSLDSSKMPKFDKKVDSKTGLRKQTKSRSPIPLHKRKVSSTKSNSVLQKWKIEYHSKANLSKPVLSETLKKFQHVEFQNQKIHKGKSKKTSTKPQSFNITTGSIKNGTFSQQMNADESKATFWAILALEDEHIPHSLKEKIADFARMEKMQTTEVPSTQISHGSIPLITKKEIKAKQQEQIQKTRKKTGNDNEAKIHGGSKVVSRENEMGKPVAMRTKKARVPRSKITKPNPLNLTLNDFNPNDKLFTLNMSPSTSLPHDIVEPNIRKQDDLLVETNSNPKKTVRFQSGNQKNNPEEHLSKTTHEIIKKRPSGKESKNTTLLLPIVKMKEQRLVMKPSMPSMLVDNGFHKSYLIRTALESIRTSLKTNSNKLDLSGAYGREIRKVLGNKINRLTTTATSIKMKPKESERRNSKSPEKKYMVPVQNDSNPQEITFEAPKIHTKDPLGLVEPLDFSFYCRIIEDALDKRKFTKDEFDETETDVENVQTSACEDEKSNSIDENEYTDYAEQVRTEKTEEDYEFSAEEELNETNSQLELTSDMSVSSFGDFDEPSPNFLQTLDSITSLSKENDPTAQFEDLEKPIQEQYEEEYRPLSLHIRSDHTELGAVTNPQPEDEETTKFFNITQEILPSNISVHWKSNAATLKTPVRRVKSSERMKRDGPRRENLGLKRAQSVPTLGDSEKVYSQSPRSKVTTPKTSQSDDIQNIYLNKNFDYSITNFFIAVDLDAKPGSSNLRETSARSYKPPWRNSEFRLLLELKKKYSDESPESSESSLSDDE